MAELESPEHEATREPAGPRKDDPTSELPIILGKNLRRLRVQRGHSLERLAKLSGVSRAMLGQVELGQSAPTINVLWKIARALDVPFSALLSEQAEKGARVLRAATSHRLQSHDGKFSSRALFPFEQTRRVEFYELTLTRGGEESAEPHAPGTSENLVVSSGTVEIQTPRDVHRLGKGDAIIFEADVPHVYRNVGDEDATMFLVMTYAEEVG